MSVSAAELARLRADAQVHLGQTCTIQTVTRTSDGMGGETESWGDTYADVPCALLEMSGNRVQTVGAMIEYSHHKYLMVAHTQAIAPGNRAVVDGVVYEVTGLTTRQQYMVLKRAIVRRLD